jgi:hypothetical protein
VKEEIAMLRMKTYLPLVILGLTIAVALVACPAPGTGKGVLTLENYMLNRYIQTLNVRPDDYEAWGPNQMGTPLPGGTKVVNKYDLTGIPAGVYDLRAMVSTPTTNTPAVGQTGSIYYTQYGVVFDGGTWFWRFSYETDGLGLQQIVETLTQQ